ncbi:MULTISPECIES: hypothetical protein [Streptomyces]|uniref:Uncharacterized protein n=2 Tax=Streptomyces TaxID=1883 RepID=A0A2U9NZW1_STRAS|nr:hypothetical protein [Streptomyces actuosus]AWT42564.1 hypothetical protein DMT42_09715 [Streptomyces actuosus]MBM4819770.1 hypothetical protein [Streptomyces actuosus]
MLKYVVCAGSQAEAQAWARLHGIPQRQCVYASSVRRIEGLRDFAVVRLRGFFGRPNRDEIEACLRRNELKRHSPLVDIQGDGG